MRKKVVRGVISEAVSSSVEWGIGGACCVYKPRPDSFRHCSMCTGGALKPRTAGFEEKSSAPNQAGGIPCHLHDLSANQNQVLELTVLE